MVKNHLFGHKHPNSLKFKKSALLALINQNQLQQLQAENANNEMGSH
jgi:hypothetical protein